MATLTQLNGVYRYNKADCLCKINQQALALARIVSWSESKNASFCSSLNKLKL